ncbi:MAG: geranylgeranylglyceryl/heptaprenylglyceryl phosphate synthase [Salinivirgaceae bacterium]|jgi:phosphoglycerol geranylgeranyltransferase|nr:geranylgeranylglyceryl/heptaprenylglyceryl phosphate synthase [Salinivirgaceae bacterium]
MHIGKLTKYDKKLAILIDPDKADENSINLLFTTSGIESTDMILVGGSLLYNNIDLTIGLIKSNTHIPVVLFPGNAFQISKQADAFMLLNLISGRNPDLLIGHHVMAAPKLKQLNIPIISTGYMLFESGHITSVQYMSNTQPLPAHKTDIAVATAIAGELIGMKQLYLEAGSGADHPVSPKIIEAVTNAVSLPIIVGGGIRTAEQAIQAWNAGANMVVIGTAAEQSPALISKIISAKATL